MSQTNMVRTLATLVLLAVVAAACGQKEGVHVGFAGGPVGAGTASEAVPAFTDADGDGIDDNTKLSQDEFAQAASSGTLGTTGTGSGTDVAAGGGGGGGAATTAGGGGGSTPAGQAQSGSGGGGGGGGGGDDGGKAPKQQTSGGTSQGVTADTITIGIHAPLTGAAPLPSESFRSGKDQYWNFPGHEVAGRKVKVEFRDDKYNPSSASQVCQELVSSVKVFLLIGAGGADQIAECARIAAAAGVPYLSSGVTEINLDKMATYYALSQSYAQQMTPLMQFITKEAKPSNKVVGLIASNTANFDDAVAAYDSAAKKAGFVPKIYRPNKQPSDAELAALANKMASEGVTVATPVMAPTQWVKLASNPQVSNVNWHGIGITMGLNTVAAATCQSSGQAVNGSTFFSPWPGLNLANQLDPNFAKGGGSDDIQWSLWGLNKTIHAAFSKMGNNLNHEAFSKAMTSGVKSGIYPNLNHTSSNHFGIDQVHVVRLSCADRQFKSGSGDIFKKGF